MAALRLAMPPGGTCLTTATPDTRTLDLSSPSASLHLDFRMPLSHTLRESLLPVVSFAEGHGRRAKSRVWLFPCQSKDSFY
jgi:hypothetical protein